MKNIDTLLDYYRDFDYCTTLSDDEYIKLCEAIIQEIQEEVNKIKSITQAK